MNDIAVTGLLIAALFLILASGVWIGLTLSGVAWIGMELLSTRPAGDAMAGTTVEVVVTGQRERLEGQREPRRSPGGVRDRPQEAAGFVRVATDERRGDDLLQVLSGGVEVAV